MNGPHTAHTLNLVPLLYIGRKASIADGGALTLAAGITRISQHEFPIQLNDTTRAFFTRSTPPRMPTSRKTPSSAMAASANGIRLAYAAIHARKPNPSQPQGGRRGLWLVSANVAMASAPFRRHSARAVPT